MYVPEGPLTDGQYSPMEYKLLEGMDHVCQLQCLSVSQEMGGVRRRKKNLGPPLPRKPKGPDWGLSDRTEAGRWQKPPLVRLTASYHPTLAPRLFGFHVTATTGPAPSGGLGVGRRDCGKSL